MQVEITGETERLIKVALASGKYSSIQQCLDAMAKGLESSFSRTELQSLPERIDIDQLAANQGVIPFRMTDNLPFGIWPEDESADEFLQFLQSTRNESNQSGIEL